MKKGLATSGCEKRTEKRKVFEVGHSAVERGSKRKGRKNSRGVWQRRRRVSVLGSGREPRARGKGF